LQIAFFFSENKKLAAVVFASQRPVQVFDSATQSEMLQLLPCP
jgi:hypothetical protein